MNYKLKFLPTALKEWKKLDNTIQAKFKKKLRLSNICSSIKWSSHKMM